jgi:hypothetical protein
MNVYYNPEQYGLKVVMEFDDPDASYSFDKFVIWMRISDGEIFYGQDSGCSCPSPFENVSGVESLSRLGDMKSFRDEFISWGKSYFDAWTLASAVEKVEVAKVYKSTLLL